MRLHGSLQYHVRCDVETSIDKCSGRPSSSLTPPPPQQVDNAPPHCGHSAIFVNAVRVDALRVDLYYIIGHAVCNSSAVVHTGNIRILGINTINLCYSLYLIIIMDKMSQRSKARMWLISSPVFKRSFRPNNVQWLIFWSANQLD